MADAARDHADEHLAGTRRVERKLLHDERLPVFVEHGGPHGRPPAVRAIWNEVRDISASLLAHSRVRACGDLPVWTPLAPPAPDRATESDEDRPRAAGSRARRAPRVDPDARWRAPLGAALAAGELGRGTGAGDPRVHPVPQGRPLAARRRAAPPLLGRPWLCERARRPARQRGLRGRAPRRVPAPGAGRRRGRARVARRAAVVHRARGHDRHLVGRLQRPPGRRAASAAARLRRQPLLDRRPLRRRRPLHGRRAARHRHARLGLDDARLQRPPAGSRDRGRGRLAPDVVAAPARDAALGRGLGHASTPRRVLEAGLGVRRLRRVAGAGVHGRRLERRLHERDPALPRGLRRAAQGADRPLVAQLPRGRHARPCDRVPAGDAALVRPLAARPRDRDHGRAAAAGLDAGVGRSLAAPRAPRRALGHRALVAVAGDPHPRRSRSARAASATPTPPTPPCAAQRCTRTAPMPATGARTARPPTSRPTSARRTGAHSASTPTP